MLLNAKWSRIRINFNKKLKLVKIMPKTESKNVFKDFTNLYELSKTLRFELKPTEETKELLKKTNLQGKTPVQVDREIDELYEQEMKPLFDKLHEKFTNESLKKVSFNISDLEKLENLYLELEKLRKELKILRSNKDNIDGSKIKTIEIRINKIEGGNKKNAENTGEIEKLQNRLRENIIEKFNETAKKWKNDMNGIETGLYNEKGKKKIKIDIKKETYEFLKEDNVLAILAHFNTDKIDKIRKFQRFTTYFTGFNKNRENYYDIDAKETGIANRSINKNLIIFFKNRQNFNRILGKMQSLGEYKKYFELNNYQNCLTQDKIEDLNENVIGKVNLEKNLFCQKENSKLENKDNDKKIYLPNLEKLQKQIGCRTKQQKEQEKSGKSIYPEYLKKIGFGFQISKDGKGKYQIWEALDSLTEKIILKMNKVRENYRNFFDNWQKENYNLNEIWLRKESINTISGRWFGGNNWYILGNTLNYLGTGKIKNGEYKIPQFISLQDLKEAMDVLENGVNFDIKKSRKKFEKEANKNPEKFYYSPENLFKKEYQRCYKKTLFETFLAIWQSELDYKFTQIFDGYKIKDENGNDKFISPFLDEFKKQSKYPFDKNKKSGESSIHVETVKNLVEDGYLRLFQLTKYHNLDKKGEAVALPMENRFYEALKEFWENNEIVTYHKAFQATLTQKPYSEDKIKLNFNCGYLLNGWAQSYETYGALIFLKNNKYYLGIINGKGLNKDEKSLLYGYTNSENVGKRLIYDFQKPDNKNTPRLFIRSKGNKSAPAVKEFNLPVESIIDIYDQDLFKIDKKNPEKHIPYLKKIIDYFKLGFKKHPSYKHFDFNWRESGEYKNIADFYKDVLDSCYKIGWETINYNALSDLAKIGRIYLFQIYNKDFELDENIGRSKYGNSFKPEKTCGTLNSHTKIFLELLKPENASKLKLLGNGELFFRDASKDKKYKKDKNSKEILDAKRYYEPKYFLHFPIQIKGKGRNLKKDFVNQIIRQNYKDIKIIGIDRGEKNLLYYFVVDSQGRGIKKGRLNVINDVDYNAKLQERQDKRNQARLDWEEIGNIKNFKEGYLSQAVSKIYELVIKYNTIVVLEDLNSEFKAKRMSMVEKSVYKKFELALAKKLNHLILKNKKADEIGGVLNAYQLTPYIKPGDMNKFEKAKQWGIMFYVRANYTSTTDPLTGWRKHKYISNSDTISKIQDFFNPDSGVRIDYDPGKKCFKFSYENNDGNLWKLFAFKGLQRFYWDNEKRKMRNYDLHKEFETLFLKLDKSKNINQQIKEKDNFRWKSLVFLWNLLNQIRNTDKNKKGNENDFLQSPVWSEKYLYFYDSRKVAKDSFPDNGDANGAYNIARKGAMILERIKNCKDVSKFGNDNNGKNPENGYFISDKDWDEYAQTH